MASALQAAYDARLAKGDIRPDPAQDDGLRALIRLEADLAAAPAAGGLKGFFRKPEAEHGVYLWGPVGRGKSMLMDLFFETVTVEKKRRTHFHVFMGEIHRLIGTWRTSDAAARKARFGQHKGDDPIVPAALLRRVPGHRHRRRHDPGAAVRGPLRARRDAGRHLQPRA